jgi:hypothetical protein
MARFGGRELSIIRNWYLSCLQRRPRFEHAIVRNYNGFAKQYKTIPVCGSVSKQGRDMQWHELGGRAVDVQIFPRSAQWLCGWWC